MDVIDRGSELAEQDIEARVKAQRIIAAKSALPFLGHCYYCETELSNKNFCDVECRDDYDELMRKQRFAQRG